MAGVLALTATLVTGAALAEGSPPPGDPEGVQWARERRVTPAPLPFETGTTGVTGEKVSAETAEPLTEGVRGLPLTAGGIAVLLAGVWGISRRRKTRFDHN